jgi:hypothetical protein
LKASSTKFGHLEQVFKFWEEKIVPEFEEHGIEYPVIKLKSWVRTVLIVAFALSTVKVMGIGVQIHMRGGYFYTSPFESNPLTVTGFIILGTMAALSWVLTIVFVTSFTKLVQEAFKSVNQYKTKVGKQNGCNMAERFKATRQLHLNLCELVNDLDEDLGWFYGIIFTFNTCLGIFTLYQIIKKSLTTIDMAVYILWLLTGLASTGIPAVYAALVNKAVSTMYNSFYT